MEAAAERVLKTEREEMAALEEAAVVEFGMSDRLERAVLPAVIPAYLHNPGAVEPVEMAVQIPEAVVAPEEDKTTSLEGPEDPELLLFDI
jgi:hypothetical protein